MSRTPTGTWYKTTMWINWEEQTVSVRHGYGAKIQELQAA